MVIYVDEFIKKFKIGDLYAMPTQNCAQKEYSRNGKAALRITGHFLLQRRQSARMIAIIRAVVAAGRIGGRTIAEGATKQRMDRLAERLPPQIPQCDIDGADRLDVSAVA